MLREMLSEGSKISSKRVLAFVLIILLAMCVSVELFTDKEVSENTFESLVYLIGANIVAIASDNVSKYFGKNKFNEEPA